MAEWSCSQGSVKVGTELCPSRRPELITGESHMDCFFISGKGGARKDLSGVGAESRKKSHQGCSVSTREEEWQELRRAAHGLNVQGPPPWK